MKEENIFESFHFCSYQSNSFIKTTFCIKLVLGTFIKKLKYCFEAGCLFLPFNSCIFFKKLYKEYITVRYIIQSNCIDTRLRSKGNIDRLLHDNNTSGKICAKWRDSIATTILVMTHFRWDDTILFCVPTHFAAK